MDTQTAIMSVNAYSSDTCNRSVYSGPVGSWCTYDVPMLYL